MLWLITASESTRNRLASEESVRCKLTVKDVLLLKNVIFSLMYTKFKYKAGLYDFGGAIFLLKCPAGKGKSYGKKWGDTCVYEDGIIQIILLMAHLSKLYKTSLFYKNVSITSILTNISSPWAPNLVSKSCVCSKDNTQFCL